jgi:hypothetical protein
MNVIGIRTTPSVVYFSVISFKGEVFEVSNQQILIPKSFDISLKLKYVRKTVLDIFNEYNISKAGIRITEPVAQSSNIDRVMVEAVIQELIASSPVNSYFRGIKNSMSCRLGLKSDGTITELIDGRESFKGIDNWSQLNSVHRECILVAFSALN